MKEIPFANALAIVAAFLYLICVLGIMLFGTGFFAFWAPTFHGVDLMKLPLTNPDFTSTLLGFVEFVIAGWIAGYIFAVSYNKFK